jgi:hypothetical protein
MLKALQVGVFFEFLSLTDRVSDGDQTSCGGAKIEVDLVVSFCRLLLIWIANFTVDLELIRIDLSQQFSGV